VRTEKSDLAILAYYLLVFLVTSALCGVFFIFVIRPIQWWLLTDMPYEKPTAELLLQTAYALGFMAIFCAVVLFVYQKVAKRRGRL
jgi:hypothetical protein